MEPTRPLAKRRLLKAIDDALGAQDLVHSLSLAEIQRKLAVLAQEKRFLTFAAMMQESGHLTSQEIAFRIKDQHSNVLRNLHVLVSERLFLVQRDEETGICRYTINGDAAGQISAFFTRMDGPPTRAKLRRNGHPSDPRTGETVPTSGRLRETK